MHTYAAGFAAPTDSSEDQQSLHLLESTDRRDRQKEQGRPAASGPLDVLKTEKEDQYDGLTQMACLLCGTPVSMIALIDENRRWLKATTGVASDGAPIDPSICRYAMDHNVFFVVTDAREDERFRDLPEVHRGTVRFCAGAPIAGPDGLAVGALCVVDDKPRELSEEQQSALMLLSRQAAGYLLMRRQVQLLLAAATERDAAEVELRRGHGRLEEANRRLKELASTDALTGLLNRRALDHAMADGRAEAGGSTGALSALMIDVDHFKRINDRLSHETGDAVLRRVAELLRMNARSTDTLSRYGGEEFVLLMPGASLSVAMTRAERLRQAVAEDPESVAKVTISIGVATAAGEAAGIAVAELLAQADQALYRAKREGRNCVRNGVDSVPVPVPQVRIGGIG